MSKGHHPNRQFLSSLSGLATVGLSSSLPAEFRVVNAHGEPANSLRRQFSHGKASRKKRGK